MKKKDIALGYAALAAMYLAIALTPLFLFGFHDLAEFLEFAMLVFPSVTLVLGLAVANVALAVAVWRVERFGRGKKAVLVTAAWSLAALSAIGAARGLMALHGGEVPSFASLMPYVAAGIALIYAVQAVGVVRVARSSSIGLKSDR